MDTIYNDNSINDYINTIKKIASFSSLFREMSKTNIFVHIFMNRQYIPPAPTRSWFSFFCFTTSW